LIISEVIFIALAGLSALIRTALEIGDQLSIKFTEQGWI